jgi:SNF family Na+-dependent transporter
VVLRKSESINDFEGINPFLFILYIMSLLICYAVVHKGVKTSGKIILVTAILPYFFFILLFIRSLFLEGAYKGVIYLFTPKWKKLFGG